jgi:hypothetical protein
LFSMATEISYGCVSVLNSPCVTITCLDSCTRDALPRMDSLGRT